VDDAGKFMDGTPYAGLFIKDADAPILEDLKQAGKLFSAPRFTHSYPFCWRCDTPLMYYARSTWFIEMTKICQQLVESNRSVNWIPENIKEGRMGNFVANVRDWGLSRERYWGTPLPVWVCDCGHIHVIGSIAESKELGNHVPENIELHKPFIDEITLTCPECGGVMKRTPEVIDCWYDSGSMPFAQWHYPFENKELFEENFPANFISEAIDQTRGWFYTLLAISTLLFERAPFENCIVLGHVNDKDGRKMSKHLGNTVDPWVVLDKQGADAVRWYFYSNSSPWLPNRFYDEAVSEYQRKFIGTLWNTYAFYILYANIDGFDPTKYTLEYDKLSIIDRWILSRLNTLIRTVDTNLDTYRITEAARALSDFVDELSNWYVRRGRQRYWGSEMTQDKINAYMTLYTVLEQVVRLAAPFIPFMTERIYQNMVCRVDASAPDSVHLCDYPVCNAAYIQEDLEAYMADVLQIVTLGRACRNVASIKNRQPVATLYVQGRELPQEYAALIADELNAKQVRFVEDASEFVDYVIKPQMRTLGPKYGKMLNDIRTALQQVDGHRFMRAMEENGEAALELSDQTVTLSKDDVLVSITQRAGFVSQENNGMTVVLDTNLTAELLEEGFVREVISKIQNMRKNAGFEVVDHIAIYYDSQEADAMALLNANAEQIAKEVLADEIHAGDGEGYTEQLDINGQAVTATVRKL